MPSTVVKIDGGHSTLIKDLSPQEVEHVIRDGRRDEHEFVYFHTTYGDNGQVIDPKRVVALFATE